MSDKCETCGVTRDRAPFLCLGGHPHHFKSEEKSRIEQLESELSASKEEVERLKGEADILECFSDYIFSIMNPEFSEFADPQRIIEAGAIRKIMATGVREAVKNADFSCWSDNPESIVRAYSEALLIYADKLDRPKDNSKEEE